METTKPIRNEKARRNRRREVTIEILRTKHEVFTAAAEEIARRAKVPVTAEAVMAFLLEAECDAKDIADMYCSRVLHWPLEWIDKDSNARAGGALIRTTRNERLAAESDTHSPACAKADATSFSPIQTPFARI